MKYLVPAKLVNGWVSGLFLSAALFTCGAAQAALDHSHASFDALLKKHVAWNAAGNASSVSYKGFADDRATLKTVLDQYATVSKAEYDAMKRDEKMAFLVNVYNAYTIELILTKYPDIKSIKNIGGVFGKPWGIKFVKILGEEKTLDNVEHDMLRAQGMFDEPRVHFVVNCASIGCPALRPEAITAAKLENQLEDGTKRFLRDKSRNRYNMQTGRLEVSKIFDWFKVDWTRGSKGFRSREVFFAKYAELLSDDAAIQSKIKDGKVDLAFQDYDWGLNGR
jgi:Protein of unknown function, DUF547